MMWRTARLFMAVLVLLGTLVFVGAQPTQAEDLFTSGTSGIDCSQPDTKKSAVCQEQGQSENPITSPGGTIENVTDVVAVIAGAAAVIMLVVGGIRYITSGGDSGKASTARNMITNALIGIVVIVLARTLVIYLVTKLS